ncbi:hypothetical protein MMC25_000327 [Agyrium rufum]|nr:hypothetical protein [Agyrium rufum]
MEHLVSFGRSTLIQVPYVCQRTFSGSIFDYPERQGWRREALYKGDFEGHTLEETRGLLQEWLFFGPLFHAFDTPGMNFCADDFIRRDGEGQVWITTEKLPVYAKKWFFPSDGPHYTRTMRPEQERQADFQHLYPALREIHRFVLRYCGMNANNGRLYPKPSFWPLTPELSLSIIALCDSITHMGFEGTDMSFNLTWGLSGLLYHRMIASGWCPNALSRFTTSQSIGLFYSAETLGNPPLIQDHSKCNEWLCKLDQVDEVTYKTQHVIKDCDWADGLGNPKKNELPICQLRRLQALANDVVGTADSAAHPWWCDTLCVPVDSILHEFRKIAIRRMATTYREASKVLVLDSGFLKVSSHSSILEVYIRFRMSNWMRRLWTLQEGFLAKLVMLRTSDGMIDLNYLDRAMLQTEVTTRRIIYTRYSFLSHTELGTFLRQAVRPTNYQPGPQFLRLESLWKQLEYRATSKRSDETICLSSMLGFGERKLAGLLDLGNEDYEGRMMYFLSRLDAIPITILYQPPPRLQTVGFRWAPTSFLSCFRDAKTNPHRDMRGTAQIGPDGRGLLFKSEGLVVVEEGENLPLIGNDFHVQLAEKSDALLRLGYVGTLADQYTDRWVAYAVSAVVSAIGDNKLMPIPDFPCRVINGKTGHVRDNASWIIGRIVRDYEYWIHKGKDKGASGATIQHRLREIIDEKWEEQKKKAKTVAQVPRPKQAGLCVSVYVADEAYKGYGGHDALFKIGIVTAIVQLGIAAIPCGVFGDWGILAVTAAGTFLSFLTGSLPQWSKEKWACRKNSDKTVILTKGNGSQHAIVVLGNGRGLDLEDLASGSLDADTSASFLTRAAIVALGVLWILLLITAAGIKQHTWFLLAVGGLGMMENLYVSGRRRLPEAFGVPLVFERVIAKPTIMDTLFAVEEAYPDVGRSMRDTFFPGRLRISETARWKEYEEKADKAKKKYSAPIQTQKENEPETGSTS